MHQASRVTALLIALSAVALAQACGGDDAPVMEASDAGTAPDGGDADSGVVVPPGCDLTKDPKDAPACVDNGVGVFVAPTGNDSASGSKALKPPHRPFLRGFERRAAAFLRSGPR